MHGAWRDKNGTPLTRVKQLAPSWYARQVDEYKTTEADRRKRVMNDQVNSYQTARRHRQTIGRDLMTGCELKPRQILPPGFGGIPPRLKKPVTIVPEFTTMFEAADNGIIGEPDTKKGMDDWDKYKKEPGAYKRIINPDD